MENRNDGQVIFLKDLVFAALYQWKKALVLLIVFALVLGGVKGISSFLDMKNAVLQSENSEQQELQMEVYDTKKASLEQQIKTNRENARQQQTYLKESVLMNLDPYNYYELYYSFFVDSGYQIMPNMIYQNPDMIMAILHGYNEALICEEFVQEVATLMQTQTYYVSEIITTNAYDGSRSFTIRVKTPDMESANALLDYLQKYIVETQESISRVVAPHEISVSEVFVSKRMDSSIADLQQEQMDKLAALNDSLVGLQTQKNALELPKPLVADMTSVVKDAVIFAVVGGVLGVFLTVLGAWIAHIAGGKIYSARTMISRTGTKVLGCIDAGTKRDAVSQWLRSKEGRNTKENTTQQLLVATNVGNLCMEKNHLLVVGSVQNVLREAFVKSLKQAMPACEVVDGGDILQDVSALSELVRTDAVLMVEQCSNTRHSDVQQQMDMIEDYGKQLVGCVLLDG